MRDTRATFIAAITLLFASVASAASDPPVVPGRDPGGVPVAVIGSGIDYTQPEIAQRLARDGEGTLIGYDVVDADQHPFNAAPPAADIAVVSMLLAEGQSTTIVPVRADVSQLASLAAAIEFAVKTPARVIAFATPGMALEKRALWSAVAKLFPETLFIVAAGDDGRDLDNIAPVDAAPLDNVIVITAAAADGTQQAMANFGRTSVDLATPIESRFVPPTPGAPPSITAAARIAALAARLQGSDGSLTAAAAKAKILTLAKPWPDAAIATTRSGTITEPQRFFWLE